MTSRFGLSIFCSTLEANFWFIYRLRCGRCNQAIASYKLNLKLKQELYWCLAAYHPPPTFSCLFLSSLWSDLSMRMWGRASLSLQKYQLVVFYRFYCSDIAAWSIAREPESMAEWKWYILSQFSISTSRKLPACILKATNNKKFAEKENFQTKEIL